MSIKINVIASCLESFRSNFQLGGILDSTASHSCSGLALQLVLVSEFLCIQSKCHTVPVSDHFQLERKTKVATLAGMVFQEIEHSVGEKVCRQTQLPKGAFLCSQQFCANDFECFDRPQLRTKLK